LHEVAKSIVQSCFPFLSRLRCAQDLKILLFSKKTCWLRKKAVSDTSRSILGQKWMDMAACQLGLIAEAKSILKIPVVGNGDILNVEDALRMLRITRCDALMIGRGSIINPFLFHQIKAHFSGQIYSPQWHDLVRYFDIYRAEVPAEIPDKTRVNKLKQLMGFLF